MSDDGDVSRSGREVSSAARPDFEKSGPAATSNSSEWLQSKPSFASIVVEATGVANMLDQEKRYVLGLTQAVSEIENSFARLHSRFTEIENRVADFESVWGRLSYRLETAFQSLHEHKDSERELTRNYAALEAAVESAEQKLVDHSKTIRLLSEENRTLRETLAPVERAEQMLAEHSSIIRNLSEDNRTLRETLAAVERDGRLIVDEVARMRNEIALLDSRDETAPRHEPAQADRGGNSPADTEKDSAASVQPALPQDTTATVAGPDASERDTDPLLQEVSRSIDYHKNELQRMQAQAEALRARIEKADTSAQRSAVDRIESNKTDTAAARAASERKLGGIKALSRSYEALVQDLENSRIALNGHPPAAQDARPEMAQEAPQEVFQNALKSEPQQAGHAAAPEPLPESEPNPEPLPAQAAEPPAPFAPQTLMAGSDISKINSLRATYERRTEELKAELMQERRERQFAESSLQVSRAERLQLQRELAKFRAMGWRKISPDAAAETAAPHEPDEGRRRITAA